MCALLSTGRTRFCLPDLFCFHDIFKKLVGHRTASMASAAFHAAFYSLTCMYMVCCCFAYLASFALYASAEYNIIVFFIFILRFFFIVDISALVLCSHFTSISIAASTMYGHTIFWVWPTVHTYTYVNIYIHMYGIFCFVYLSACCEFKFPFRTMCLCVAVSIWNQFRVAAAAPVIPTPLSIARNTYVGRCLCTRLHMIITSSHFSFFTVCWHFCCLLLPLFNAAMLFITKFCLLIGCSWPLQHT